MINGEDAAYIVTELEAKSGYKLKRNEKTGVVTIDESVKRQTGKGFSDKLASTLAASIAPTAKVTDGSGNSKEVAFTVTLNTVRDQDSSGTSVFFDRYATRSIDVNDFKATNSTAPELSVAILGHVLDEYTQTETTFKALGALNPTGQERASHTHGLFVESQILSDSTGQQEITRAQTGVGKIVRFNYTSVQYDILTKGSAGPGANAIEKVTKKKTP